jgi:radical SAM superfamily enzyme YgiQ (UPF0313 family)
VNTHRGCLADCTFCSITFHQGRTIQSRSAESVLREAERLVGQRDFRGTITDVGGPTANMWGMGCKLLEKGEPCLGRDCLSPDVCPALRVDTASEGYRRLLAMVKSTRGVKHAFVSSGVRYDLLRMKLAPEHASDDVLRVMNKPGFEEYERYEADYKRTCSELGRDQHLVNYFIVGHPGTTLKDAVVLFEKLLERNYAPEQVQEFIPLPMTRGCVQYTTGVDPLTLEELYVPRGGRERRVQKALVRWKDPENRKLIEEALREAGREDLLEPFQRALRRSREGGPRGAKRPARGTAAPRPAGGLDLDTCG